jgi:hypothetical protein
LSVFRRAPLTGWTIGLSLRGSPAVSALPKLDDKFFDALFIEPDHPELYPTSSMRDSVKRLSLSQQQDTSDSNTLYHAAGRINPPTSRPRRSRRD